MSTSKEGDEAVFFDFCSHSRSEMIRLAYGSEEDRKKATVPISQINENDALKQEKLTLWEHASVVAFLAVGVPNGVFTIPAITYLVGRFAIGSVSNAFIGLGAILLPLAIMPQHFVRDSLHSWMAVQVSKYFSFRTIAEEYQAPSPERPQILVAPPHGVFPYGNLMAMLAWPSYMGHHFLGLASSAALRPPIFKQIMRGIGVIDASRSSARKALESYPHSIGISTGGVAEVFETNADDEVILLKERVGLIKLAIRTGADLVPCYIFGNTKLLSCWMGEGIPGGRFVLEKISRKLGFALIVIFGRFGLPIPRRIPLLAVKGKHIRTDHLKCEEPPIEVVMEVQNKLIKELQSVFDRNKHLYGWKDKRLIIK